MSVVRWGVDGSHVYIYHDVAGGVTCCGCDGATCISDEAMRAHLKWHIEKGDTVPPWVVEYFEPPPEAEEPKARERI